MEVIDDFYKVVFVFKDNVLYSFNSIWESYDEEWQKQEKFLFNPFIIIISFSQLCHYILQIFFIIYKIIRKLVIESLVDLIRLPSRFILVHAYIIPISLTHVLLLFTFIYLVNSTLKSQHQNFILKFHTLSNNIYTLINKIKHLPFEWIYLTLSHLSEN